MSERVVIDLSEFFSAMRHVRDALSDSEMAQVMFATGKAVGVAGEEHAITYPLQSGKPLAVYYDRVDKKGRGYKSKFKSLKQQRKVMALVSKGKVPYRRTGLLGRSVTSQVESFSSDLVNVFIGTNDQKARWVVDEESQSFYHKGNWQTVQRNLLLAAGELQTVAENAFVKQVTEKLRRDR